MVMHVALSRSIQPLQARAHHMWADTGEGDDTRAIRGDLYGGKSMQEMFSLLFKGKALEFLADYADRGY